MAGILVTHCADDTRLADELRSRLVEMAVPEPAEFVTLTSVMSEKPLMAEMAAAGAVVVLLSERAIRDTRVMTEAGAAVSLGKPVVAVILDDTPIEALDFIEAQVWIPAAGVESPAALAREIHTAALDLLTQTDSE
jgi:nucleoside 2-deoxyribosyltransferase